MLVPLTCPRALGCSDVTIGCTYRAYVSHYREESAHCSLILPNLCRPCVPKCRSLPRTVLSVVVLDWVGWSPCPIKEANFLSPGASIMVKHPGSMGTKTQEKEMLNVPRLHVARPFIGRAVPAGGHRKRTSRALFQALFSSCIGLAWGPGLAAVCWCVVLTTMTDLFFNKEWAVPTPQKSPVFSLGAVVIQSNCLRAQCQGVGWFCPFAQSDLSSYLAPGATGPQPESLHQTAFTAVSPCAVCSASTCLGSPETLAASWCPRNLSPFWPALKNLVGGAQET